MDCKSDIEQMVPNNNELKQILYAYNSGKET